MPARHAFTLVEILIVVVILGILAAIVVPQFANATDEARAGNLKSQVKQISDAVDRYKAVELGNTYPDITGDAGTSFQPLITRKYIKGQPINPINRFKTCAAAAAVIDGTTTRPTGEIGGVADVGWVYDASLGVFGAAYFNEATGKVESGTP